MRLLSGKEQKEAIKIFDKAVQIARKSTCLRDKCGSVIMKNGKVIGVGFNSTPAGLESQRRCLRKHELSSNFKSDKTCCIHAEQRAIIDALRRNPNKIKGSRIYFVRLDTKDNKKPSGMPYCTICSKISLDVGIKEFVLWHENGIYVYNTEEYNNLSFAYKN